ncbi:MAG: hypothetical protein DRO89_06330, partial [Candidatus Altiarchaeales archaeon]
TTRAGDAHSLGDIAYHILGNVAGAIALPITSLIVKEVIASTVKQMGGTQVKLFPEETDEFKYMPPITLTPPEMPVEPRDEYKPTLSVYDTGFEPSIEHEKPEQGTPPETPEMGEEPPHAPTPLTEEPPYTPPPPSEPTPPTPPPTYPPTLPSPPTREFSKVATTVENLYVLGAKPFRATVIEEGTAPKLGTVIEEET